MTIHVHTLTFSMYFSVVFLCTIFPMSLKSFLCMYTAVNMTSILKICALFLVLSPTLFHRMDFSLSSGGEVRNSSYYIGSIKRS